MSTSISAADIERVKSLAKQAKSEFPDIPHGKRVDHFARKLFGARHFHELNQWRETTIEQQAVADEGGLSTCSYCRLQFVPSLKEDCKLHRERHDAFETAVMALKYVPEARDEREARKKLGYAEAHGSGELSTRVHGTLDVIRAWFDRSLEAAIDSGYWKRHPTFDTYVSYLVGDLPGFAGDVREELERRFGRVDGVIQRGHSYWYPPKRLSAR